jgi:membrane protease YdiL (CAAX protease family)
MTNNDARTSRSRAWPFAIATLSVLVVVNFLHELLSRFAAYRSLYENHAFYVPEGIDKIGGITLCVLATWVLRRVIWKDAFRELGLADSPLPAVLFALVASFPMLIGFMLTRGLTPRMEPLTIFFLTVLSPAAEEIEFRGLGMRLLQRGTGWPFWILVWPQGLLFGLGHIEQGQSPLEMAGLMLLTGSGAVVFAWLVYRWESLWFPITLHISMNLWWELFSVSKTALGGWFPFGLQIGTIMLAILVTIYWTKRKTALQVNVKRVGQPGN